MAGQIPIPISESLALIRTDFSDGNRWLELLKVTKTQPEPFFAFFHVVDDPRFESKSVDEIVAALPSTYTQEAIFIADKRAITEAEFPCLVVGLNRTGGEYQFFRSLARELPAIDSNLSIANMSYGDFADAKGADGVFRGFERPE